MFTPLALHWPRALLSARSTAFVPILALVLAALPAPAIPTGAASITAAPIAVPGGPALPNDAPTALVGSGVTDYSLAAPKLFWHTGAYCPPPPPRRPAGGPARPAANPDAASDPEIISRIATYGSAVRQLFYRNDPRPPGTCNPYHFLSNIVADDSYVYWVDDGGLVRLSTGANVGDPPQSFSPSVVWPGVVDTSVTMDLAQDGTSLYVLNYAGGNVYKVWSVRKSDGHTSTLSTILTTAGGLQTDGDYLYWLEGQNLRRYTIADGSVATIAGGVSGYYPEGLRFTCTRIYCFRSENVFIARSGSIVRYNNLDGSTSAPIYSSGDGSAIVGSLVTDGSHLFFFERRTLPCGPDPCFASHFSVLFRTGRGGGADDALYTSPPDFLGAGPGHLTTDNTFLFFQENDSIRRLPNNAAALSQTNMRVTGIEVTQGVQDLANSVLLIQNRRTFVRVYVQSDGSAVSGVTAQLWGTSGGAPLGGSPLLPANPVGTTLTVQSSPQRNNLNDSFLFELPWDWTTKSDLRLQAVLNPYQVPLQQSYANNSLSAGPFAFQPSPRFQVQLVAYGYTLNNTTYYPRFVKDILQSFSWLRRAYPVASKPGFFNDPSPGLRTNLWLVGDDNLGAQVKYPVPCPKDSKGNATCDNLRASAYVNGQLGALRAENGGGDNTVYYGMISDGAGFFPRGQDGGNNASGPAGDGGLCGDTAGVYTDCYAGHEIGHAVGRSHPVAASGAAGCGHSADDASYPYPNADIGANDGSLEGFDVGDPDPAFKTPIRVYPGTIWHDVMSYCGNEWLSDYTYKGMYTYMLGHPSSATGAHAAAQIAATTQVGGDFLSIFGDIAPDTNVAHIYHLRHLASVASVPPLVAGEYSIQLLNTQGSVLHDYAFTPYMLHDSAASADAPMHLGFGQVVGYVPGTALVRIVRHAGNVVLASQAISAHPPTVGGVIPQGVSNPVSGVVSLHWNASDPDGDALHFDILYSRDGGAHFQPLKLNVAESSTQIDTGRLGGGTAILRVVASDGANSAQSDSAPFSMADKPPQPRILTPGSGTHIHYGQLVNFSGSAEDFQDGGVDDAHLVWSNQKGTLGTGTLLSATNLPVGVNHITLAATNRAGLSATTAIDVVVDDDLSLPGPTLTAGPMPIGWQVPANTTALQTVQVYIGNSGSGSLTWTAASDATWLTVGAASGTAPGNLTLSASPAGLTNGTTATAYLTLTGSAGGSPPQTIVIPVSLSMGDIRDSFTVPGGPKVRFVFLPVARR